MLRKLPALPVRRVLALMFLALVLPATARAQTCARTITADVVAFDQVFFWNRLGAVQPQGMMYALRRDVVPISGTLALARQRAAAAGQAPAPARAAHERGRLPADQLPEPARPDAGATSDQPATRTASVHVVGHAARRAASLDDGSNVGANPSSLVDAGRLDRSTRSTPSARASTCSTAPARDDRRRGRRRLASTPGLFGAVNVEPAGARVVPQPGDRPRTCDWRDHAARTRPAASPIIDYDAVYPAGHPRAGHARSCNMLARQRDRPHRPDRHHHRARTRRPLPGRAPIPAERRPSRTASSRSASSPSSTTTRSAPCRRSRSSRTPMLEPHAAQRPRRLRHQLRHRRHRRGDPRQPLRRRPDGELHRVQVRGVLPHLLGGRRPGHGRRRAGQRAVHERADRATATRLLHHAGAEGDQGLLSPTTRRTSTTAT